MEPKDWLTLAGLAVTFSLGIYNFYASQRSARRASIVEVLTAQRLKWGEAIQNLVGSFCGTAYYLRFSAVKDSDEERKNIEEIDRLRHLIPLHLCERTSPELAVENCAKYIASVLSRHSSLSDEQFCAKLEELIRCTQDLLNDNWQSIQLEAEQGANSPRRGAKPPTRR